MYISLLLCSETTREWLQGLVNVAGCVYSKHCTAHPHCVFTGVWSSMHCSLTGVIWCRSSPGCAIVLPLLTTPTIRKESWKTPSCIFIINKLIPIHLWRKKLIYIIGKVLYLFYFLFLILAPFYASYLKKKSVTEYINSLSWFNYYSQWISIPLSAIAEELYL